MLCPQQTLGASGPLAVSCLIYRALQIFKIRRLFNNEDISHEQIFISGCSGKSKDQTIPGES